MFLWLTLRNDSRSHLAVLLNQRHHWRLTGEFGTAVAFAADKRLVRFHNAFQQSIQRHFLPHCEADSDEP